MHLATRSLAFPLTIALALATPLAPALEAQTEPLALVCEAAHQEPLRLRIDYEQDTVNRFPAKFAHDQISWQVAIRNGATTDFKYDRNRALLTLEIKPPAATGHAPAAERPAVAAVPGSSYHCRRAG